MDKRRIASGLARALPRTTNRWVAIGGLATVGLAVAALVMTPSALTQFGASPFLPHTFCYLNNRQLILLHAASDAAIWLSYVAISCTLVYLVWRTRREIPFSWMFLAFGLFIVACGFTHFMEIVVLWRPLYWLAGDVKLITALASVVTAVALPAVVPQVHAMVSAAHLSEDRRLQVEQANGELQRLSTRVLSVQDEERRRIARELHDGVGQYLAAIKMSCEVAHAEAEQGRPVAMRDSLALIDRCSAEVRTMSHLLHPPLLEEMGLASAVPWYVDGFRKRSGIAVDLEMPSQLRRLPSPVEVALFRVLQESLTNIHRHSNSSQASVRLQLNGSEARLQVQDRGKGFDLEGNHAVTAGVGISGMRERVRELGGEFRLASDQSGTRVEASIILKEDGTE